MTITRDGTISRRALGKLAGASLIASMAPFAPARAQAQKTIRLAHHVTTESDQQVAAERFRDLLAEYANGAIDVQILPAGQMGGQREIIESVSLGTLEMGYGESGLYANYAPRFGILSLPYLFRDLAHWEAVATGEVGDKLAKELVDASGLRIVNWINGGARDTYLRTRAVDEPADFKGIKIRVPESPVFVQTFSTFGATPTPIPAPEMYTALQTGVVDAMEGSPETGFTFKIFEVTKYLSKTRHILLDGSFVINDSLFQGLTADEQSALMRAAQEAAAEQRKAKPEREAVWFKRLAESGLQGNEVDVAAFREAVAPIQERFAAEAGAADLLTAIRSA